MSPYYIEHSVEDTAVPNIVTAVLADYRGYDTMFETSVIFAAGIACLFLLRVYRRKSDKTRLYRHVHTRAENCPRVRTNSNASTRFGCPMT